MRRSHPIDAPGTDESTWQGWSAGARLPEADLGGVRSVVVVAPHPDDEVLGFGGSLSMLAERGVRLRVVSVTDGEGSHPDSPTTAPEELVRLRAEERSAALADLGADDADVVRLGVPDGKAAGAVAQLSGRLRHLLDGFDLCVTSWEGDLHPDHMGAGRSAEEAARACGVDLLRYPVWMWHWAEPASDAVPWDRARRVSLSAEALARKKRAVSRFRTQIEPLSDRPGDEAVLAPGMVAHFGRGEEVVFA
ncbi:PIG-L deacetylase family protein [Nocardiopsis salina]|uniref:PIG-L deacetylase family protein n=1 Tax=Nocardiopsis salina TaxID=245836 RepID=UPI00034B8BC6|nr:PIG-L family deacetylase [Nocardiopsis salina]